LRNGIVHTLAELLLLNLLQLRPHALVDRQADEGEKAFLHRFVTAGAAVRYRALHRHETEDIVALEVALRRNDRDWFETLPGDITKAILHKLYYGHFFCHVFHQDYVLSKGHNALELEHRMWALLDARGAEYPAEHNVGHLYNAKPVLLSHYMSLDPRNCFNPGIGRSSNEVDPVDRSASNVLDERNAFDFTRGLSEIIYRRGASPAGTLGRCWNWPRLLFLPREDLYRLNDTLGH
jgi:hypothetical protein